MLVLEGPCDEIYAKTTAQAIQTLGPTLRVLSILPSQLGGADNPDNLMKLITTYLADSLEILGLYARTPAPASNVSNQR